MVAGMSAQPAYPAPEVSGQARVPRTIGGISAALLGSRRAQFFAELLQAEQGGQLDEVITVWWGRAILDSDPGRDAIRAAAEAGTLPATTIEDIRARRQARAGQ